MMWHYFDIFMITSLVLWVGALVLVWGVPKRLLLLRDIFIVVGCLSLGLFTTMLWQSLDRPPLRTLGETRLWYSLFLGVAGFILYKRWRYTWLLTYCLGLAVLFLLFNYFRPETHNKTLMPALQSVWFVPHVIVYMIAYALLGASSAFGFKGLFKLYKEREMKKELAIGDNVVVIGFGFLTLGLVFGALWAKEAWGHYWTWDPKETWAFLTWIAYLFYIHYRHHRPYHYKVHISCLAFAFVVLLLCWFGINYLPAAQSSVHVYS